MSRAQPSTKPWGRGAGAGLVVGSALALAGCIQQAHFPDPEGAGEGAQAQPASASHQVAQGRALFKTACTGCHGKGGRGEADVPGILGPDALPKFPEDRTAGNSFALHDLQDMQVQQQTRTTGDRSRGAFVTMQDVFDYLAIHAREKHLGSPSPEEGWAVLAFMMAAQGGDLPEGGLDAANASELRVPRP